MNTVIAEIKNLDLVEVKVVLNKLTENGTKNSMKMY